MIEERSLSTDLLLSQELSSRQSKEKRLGAMMEGVDETVANKLTGRRNDGNSWCQFPVRITKQSIGLIFLALTILAAPATSFGQVAIGVSVTFAPPALPVYVQPPCPAAGYIWTPGYWAYDPTGGYYWVPGTWVLAPFPGALWTPGYWAWNNGVYVWNVGYWGPVVGFYGGIDYGFGYFATGYSGGYWSSGLFYYNTAVSNVSTTRITNVYTRTVVNNIGPSGVSFNGGKGGRTARPTAAQLAAARARHDPPTAAQRRQQQAAHANRQQWASVNHGQPAIAATPKAGVLSGPGVVGASRAGARYYAMAGPHASNNPGTNRAVRSRSAPMAPQTSTRPRTTISPRGTPPATTARAARPSRTARPERSAAKREATNRATARTTVKPIPSHTPPTIAHRKPEAGTRATAHPAPPSEHKPASERAPRRSVPARTPPTTAHRKAETGARTTAHAAPPPSGRAVAKRAAQPSSRAQSRAQQQKAAHPRNERGPSSG